MPAGLGPGAAASIAIPSSRAPASPPGKAPLAALHDGRLLCLASAPGSSRLDVARTIDLLAGRESVSFLAKMRPEVASAVKDLEGWVAQQQLGLDLGAHPDSLAQSAEKLLKVGGTEDGRGHVKGFQPVQSVF